MISSACAAFIRRVEYLIVKLKVSWYYSIDLPHGGMEILCKLIFKGPLKEVQKYFDSALRIQVHIQHSNSDSVMCETVSMSSFPAATSLDTSIMSS